MLQLYALAVSIVKAMGAYRFIINRSDNEHQFELLVSIMK